MSDEQKPAETPPDRVPTYTWMQGKDAFMALDPNTLPAGLLKAWQKHQLAAKKRGE